MSQSQESVSTSSESFVGQVKWFNNRLGYGFITIVSECERRSEDIFVHQQHITPLTSDYRSLQQGEYVSFQLGEADSEGEGARHTTQAVNVRGVFGGSLMCDQIPRRNMASRGNASGSTNSTVSGNTSSESRPPRSRGSGTSRPRGGRPPRSQSTY
jgi:cold shock CspA family protein